MFARALLLTTALLLGSATTSLAQGARNDAMAAPTLRANVTVAGEIVRIGDLVDNAGSTAAIAVYRAPDLGTTGTLPVAQLLATLRAHQVIGVDTRDLKEITVTRRARTLLGKDLEGAVASAIEHRNGLGDAANLTINFDRDPGNIRLASENSGAVQPTAVRYDPRTTRFDVSFEIGNEAGTAPVKLRFTGTAIETVEAAVPVRTVERGEMLKSSDVIVERRPKSEVGGEAAMRDGAVGMQARRQLRAGLPLRTADLAKPDLVQRDQGVTLVYETPGIYLTIRGKALDNGAEGDVVSVMNLQSKRVVSGTVTGRSQVSIIVPPPRLQTARAEMSGSARSSADLPIANASSVAQKAE